MNVINEINIILPAMLAGLLVLAIHVPLGIEVVKRGIIFIDLSIAQLAAMGAFFAGFIAQEHGHKYHFEEIIIIQICAFACALFGGWLFMYVEKHYKEIEETVIGCVFVLSATLILLVLSQNPHAGEHLKEILSGQLLFVSFSQIFYSAVVLVIIGAIYIKYHDKVIAKYFYYLFAVAITITVQMAGIYLVFATLIFPALGVYYIKNLKNKIIIGYLGAIGGLCIGITTALVFDLSTGPAIVWGIAAVMLMLFMFNLRQR